MATILTERVRAGQRLVINRKTVPMNRPCNATGGLARQELRDRQADPYGVPYGGGRADVRLSMRGDGEIYVLSKIDGMIRILAAVVTTPPAAPKQEAVR